MRIHRRRSDSPGLGQDPASISPPLPETDSEEDSLDSRVARIQKTRVGRGIGAAMVGLGEAIYGPRENHAVKISEAPGAPPPKAGGVTERVGGRLNSISRLVRIDGSGSASGQI